VYRLVDRSRFGHRRGATPSLQKTKERDLKDPTYLLLVLPSFVAVAGDVRHVHKV